MHPVPLFKLCWGGVVGTRTGHPIPAALILGPTGHVPTQESLLINGMSPVSSVRVHHIPPGAEPGFCVNYGGFTQVIH